MICRENVMANRFRAFVMLICLGWLSFNSAHDFDASHYPSHDIITCDICIIGGGSSCTYSAIRLKDMGKSVIVVEREDRLGGHTQTYIDPATQIPVDYGVLVWHDLDVVRNYFKRLNVSTINYFVSDSTGPTVNKYVDCITGKLLTNYTPPDPSAALAAYGAQLATYPYLVNGFDLPYPVPEDLLLPFGDFVTKYSLQNIVDIVLNYGQGIGDLLSTPTIYVIKLVGLDVLQSLQTYFLATASHDNSEVYQKALGVLGSDVLLSSHVVATDRCNDTEYVKVLVKTPDGLKLIQSKKIIISIPPKIRNLIGFDLSEQERTLFAQFGNSAYYAGVLKDSGIPDNFFITNHGANTTYNLPILPGIYFVYYGAPGLKVSLYGSPHELPIDQVKSNFVTDVKRYQAVENLSSGITPSFEVFSKHGPFVLRVSPEAIAAGFYMELYGLQGQSRTFYTGAAFHMQDSAMLWRFTEGLLPRIFA